MQCNGVLPAPSYSVYLRPGSELLEHAQLTTSYRSCLWSISACTVGSYYRIEHIQATVLGPHILSKSRPGSRGITNKFVHFELTCRSFWHLLLSVLKAIYQLEAIAEIGMLQRLVLPLNRRIEA